MNRRGGRLVCLALLFAAVVGALPAAGGDQVLHAPFSAGAFGRQVRGGAVWVSDASGSLRCEFLLDERAPEVVSGAEALPPSLLEDLLRQSGDGWCVVSGREGEAALQRWGREWRKVGPQLPRLIAAATDLALGSAPQSRVMVLGEPSAALTAAEAAGDAGPTQSSLRASLSRRGRGGGGPGERVRLDGRGPQGLEMRSSRRPGVLRVAAPSRVAVLPLAPEAFLPLWPLAEVLEYPAPESGTSGRRGR